MNLYFPLLFTSLALATAGHAQTFTETPLPNMGQPPRAGEFGYLNKAGTFALVEGRADDGEPAFRTSNKKQGKFNLMGVDSIYDDVHIAFRSREPSSNDMRVWSNGVPGKLYDFVGRPVVTSKGHIVYPASSGDQSYMVIDNLEHVLPGPVISDDDQIEYAHEVFQVSDDARLWAAIIWDKSKEGYRLVQNGRTLLQLNYVYGKSFQSLKSGYAFYASGTRPDGKRGHFWVINGKCGPVFDSMINSWDKELDATLWENAGKVTALINGKIGERNVSILWDVATGNEREIKSQTQNWKYERALSANGRHFAFRGRQNGLPLSEFNGKLGPNLSQDEDKTVFSPDGSDLAWLSTVTLPRLGKTQPIWVHGDKQSPPCDEVRKPQWSKSGQLAIVTRTGDRDTLYLNDEKQSSFDNIHEIRWANSQLWMLARRGKEEWLFADVGGTDPKQWLIARGQPDGGKDSSPDSFDLELLDRGFYFNPDRTLSHELRVSADGTRAVCFVTKEGRSRVVAVRRWQKVASFGTIYDGLNNLKFVEGDRAFVCNAFRLSADKDSLQKSLLVNGKSSRFYNEIWWQTNWQSWFAATPTRYYRVKVALEQTGATPRLVAALGRKDTPGVLSALRAGADANAFLKSTSESVLERAVLQAESEPMRALLRAHGAS